MTNQSIFNAFERMWQYVVGIVGDNGLPSVTTEDAGKFLRVSSDGAWAVESIPNAEGVGF